MVRIASTILEKMNYQVREKEGQIEVKREPMPYTMQSTLYSYSNTATLLAEGIG